MAGLSRAFGQDIWELALTRDGENYSTPLIGAHVRLADPD